MSTLLLLSLGCSAYGPFDLGASPGGSQDISYARALIAQGAVPDPDSFRIGGLLNEHDMPIEGEQACDQILCVKGATGVGRVVTLDQDAVFLQIGYDSNLQSDTFVRPPLNLAVVVDVSGSMSTYLDDVKLALHTLLAQLEPQDRLSVVIYGSSPETLLEPTLAADSARISEQIDALSSGGSTAMEPGMRLGYELLSQNLEAGVESRMLLFTDVRPNVGATETSAFMELVQEAADQGMNLSLFGVGLDFGYEIAEEISQVRGANYHYLSNEQRVAEVFDLDFDYLVTPLAYDLEVEITTSMAYLDSYNTQGGGEEGALVKINVATVFVSRDSGASVVLLEMPEELSVGGTVAQMELSYVDPGGATVEQSSVVLYGDAAGGHGEDSFSQTGTRKAAALVNMGMGMKALCTAYYDEDVDSVGAAYWELRDRLEAEASAMADPALDPEVVLLDKLAENAGLVRELDDTGDTGE